MTVFYVFFTRQFFLLLLLNFNIAYLNNKLMKWFELWLVFVNSLIKSFILRQKWIIRRDLHFSKLISWLFENSAFIKGNLNYSDSVVFGCFCYTSWWEYCYCWYCLWNILRNILNILGCVCWHLFCRGKPQYYQNFSLFCEVYKNYIESN